MTVSWQALQEEDRTQFWASLALRHSQGLGPRSIVRLLQYFGSAYEAIQNTASWGEAGIPANKIAQFSSGAWRSTAQVEWDAAQCIEARILMWHHTEYPPLLRALVDAPSLLYCRGDIDLLAGPCFAVVGSRQCTAEGVRIASIVTRDMTKAGVTVVSGMAQGIDRVAHVAALEGIGKSIAVLGTGIDMVYPQQHKELYERLVHEGLVVSEFAPGTAPHANNFPVRNRIISGVSLGVLVVESALRSGSLITARQALEQNRDVFAVPGPATSLASRGCQELIRQGAKPVFHAEDILLDLTETLRAFIAAKKNVRPSKYEDAQKDVMPSAVSLPASLPVKDVKIPLTPTVGCVYMERPASTLSHKKGAHEESTQPNVDERAPQKKTMFKADESQVVMTEEAVSNESVTKKAMTKKKGFKEAVPQEVMPTARFDEGQRVGQQSLTTHEHKEEMQRILDALHGASEADIDTLCLALDKNAHHVNALLIEMEVNGLVKKLPGGRFVAQSAAL